jgi:hypothetical protein
MCGLQAREPGKTVLSSDQVQKSKNPRDQCLTLSSGEKSGAWETAGAV